MSMIFTLQAGAPAHVGVGSSRIAELMAVLHMLAEPKHHLGMAREIALMNKATPRSLAAELDTFSPLWSRFRCRALYPLGPQEYPDLETELTAVRDLPQPQFTAMAAEAITRGNWDRMYGTRDPLGETAAFLDVCKEKTYGRYVLGKRLLEDPDGFRRHLLEVLIAAYDQLLEPTWQASSSYISAAKDAVRQSLQETGLGEALASLNPAGHYDAATQTVEYQKGQTGSYPVVGRTIISLPSVYVRPHLLIKPEIANAVDLPIVVQFPVKDMDVAVASVSEVQLRMAALADARRLELCRHLVNEACTTLELADRLGMSPPQASRHIGKLREAGLIISKRDGKKVWHRLNLANVYNLGSQFVTQLVR